MQVSKIKNVRGDRFGILRCFYFTGSSSAHMLTLSPASKGLFQRAIFASGVATNVWASTYSDHYSILQKFGNILKYFYNSINDTP